MTEAILPTKSRFEKIAIPPLLILFAFSLGIRLYFVLAYSFDGLYGQDSFAYFDQAVGIAENLPRGHLPPLHFFWPNGYPLLTAVFMWMMGKTEIAALLPVLLTGAALAPLAYLLCVEFFGEHGPRAGWLAGLIIAVAGQPILSSVTSMADVPGLFWAMLAVWCLARAWKFPQIPTVPTSSPKFPERVGTYKGTHRNSKANLWQLSLTGLFLALATVTRWNYAILALPFAIYALLQTRTHRTPFWMLTIPFLTGLIILIGQIWMSLHRPEGLFHQWLVGWHPRNFFGNSFLTPDGLQSFERPVWFFNLLPGLHPAYLFPLFGVAIPFGVWHTWRERNWGAMILLGGWFALTYSFLAGIPYENFRFGLGLYPPLVLFAGLGLALLSIHVSRITKFPFVKPGYWMLVIGGLLFMLGWANRMVGSFLTTQTATKQQAEEIAAELPPTATLITLGPTLILDHYTNLEMVEFFSTDETHLAQLLENNPSLFLLLNIPDIQTRWAGMRPEQNFQWLQTHALLTPLGEYPPYTLFALSEK